MRYDEAGKFFINEMELRRKSAQTGLLEKTVLTIYRWLGLYGENFGMPLFLILAILLLPPLVKAVLLGIQAGCGNFDTDLLFQNFFTLFDRSLRMVDQIGGRSSEALDMVDDVQRLLGLFSLGLLFLALRRRFERRFRH